MIEPDHTWVTLLGYPARAAIFVGATLTATSIGITARVLSELKMLETARGPDHSWGAVADDVRGLVVLSVVSQVAESGHVEFGLAARATGLGIGFLAVALLIGIPLGRRLVGGRGPRDR